MFRSFVSCARVRALPAVRRCLANLGPLVIYSALAVGLGWLAVYLGWHSAGAVLSGGLSIGLFGPIAVQEWCASITGRGFY